MQLITLRARDAALEHDGRRWCAIVDFQRPSQNEGVLDYNRLTSSRSGRVTLAYVGLPFATHQAGLLVLTWKYIETSKFHNALTQQSWV